MQIIIYTTELKDYRGNIISISPEVEIKLEISQNYDINRLKKLKSELQEWLDIRLSGCITYGGDNDQKVTT